jgi:L-aminopeptidase/D-esterase-like protein
MNNALTDVPGLKVGHWTHTQAATGCTVILCPQGATAGVDVRGGAPGTRELALLNPLCLVDKVHAIVLSGGSAFGLAAADGVMRWLEERGYGFDTRVARVPIVPAAILFDLHLGDAHVRPDGAAGYAACTAATDGPVAEGNVGAGTGATVGKLTGFEYCMKGGIGTASRQLAGGIVIGALAAVNALGDVIDPTTQQIVAGARHPDGDGFTDSQRFAARVLGSPLHNWMTRSAARREDAGENPTAMLGNTTLAVVATNVALNKTTATKVAQMAHDGFARAIRPVHTLMDGDTIFALSTGDLAGDPGLVGAVAAEVLSDAIVRAVKAARALYGVPAAVDLAGP